MFWYGMEIPSRRYDIDSSEYHDTGIYGIRGTRSASLLKMSYCLPPNQTRS